jgi:hypothetical protein
MKRTVFECDICGTTDETGENTKGLLFLDNDSLVRLPEKFRLVDSLHADKHICFNCMEIFHKYIRAKELEKEMAG